MSSHNHVRYISTRGQTAPLTFSEAVMMGLATDGGLLLPEPIPDLRERLPELRSLSYCELATEVMGCFVGPDLPKPVLEALVKRSYSAFTHPEIAPVRQVGPLHILELFHGPTLAFKDIALQFLGNLFEHILKQSGRRLNVLGATSGDTGSAAISGVRGKRGIEIFIMHPHGRVSDIQERQMTTVLDANVHNMAIAGTFDDGQRVLKEIFSDLEFKTQYCLGAVNSVNWARVLAQIVYYFHAAFRVCHSTGAAEVQVAVPTGNFGDIFAGYMAIRMGAPIRRLVLATNDNDILARFFQTGVYSRGDVHATLSPSMDIQVASNFERYLLYRLDGDAAKVRQLMASFADTGRFQLPGTDPLFVAGRGTAELTLKTIAACYNEHHYLLDPHTAVGVGVAGQFPLEDAPTICLATAHPAKFPAAITQALGTNVARHPAIDGLLDLPTRCQALPADKYDICRFIRQTLGERGWGKAGTCPPLAAG